MCFSYREYGLFNSKGWPDYALLCSTAADAQIPYVQPLCELGCGGDHTGDRSHFLQPASEMFLDSCVCEMGGSAFLWLWGILGCLTASAGDVVCVWCVAQ